MNRVVLIGRLVRDPELKTTTSGSSVVSFTIAVDNPRSRNSQERTASFIPIIAWNATAQNVANFMKKGSLVGVDGRLSQRSYTSKDGRHVNVIEVVAESVQFLERKNDASNSTASTGYNSSGYTPDYDSDNQEGDDTGIDATDPTLPF